MFLVDERLKPTACWEFEGEILVLHHPTTISPKYQAMGKWLALFSIQQTDLTSFREDEEVLNGYVTNPNPTLTPKGRTIRKVMGGGGGGQNQKQNLFPEKN